MLISSIVNSCKISIPSQVTTAVLQRASIFTVKRTPRGSRFSHRIKTSPVARSFSWVVLRVAKVRQMAAVSHDYFFFFFTITPLFGTTASWGCGFNIYHFEREINLVGEKSLETKWNNQTRIAAKFRALFVYSDQRSSSSFRTLSYEELSLFFF